MIEELDEKNNWSFIEILRYNATYAVDTAGKSKVRTLGKVIEAVKSGEQLEYEELRCAVLAMDYFLRDIQRDIIQNFNLVNEFELSGFQQGAD